VATGARITVRSWTRRYRRGRLEALELTAARVLAQVCSVAAQLPGVSADLAEPLLLQDWMPVAYLAGQIDFWKMVQQTDFGPRERASLYVFVHRMTLADPWECTLVVSADTSPSLSCEPIVFRSADTPEAQIFAKFWRDLAVRCELVLSGLD
jgi:hypothetical protein